MLAHRLLQFRSWCQQLFCHSGPGTLQQQGLIHVRGVQERRRVPSVQDRLRWRLEVLLHCLQHACKNRNSFALHFYMNQRRQGTWAMHRASAVFSVGIW